MSFFICLIYYYYKGRRQNKINDVTTQVKQINDDYSAQMDQVEYQNCVKLRAKMMSWAVRNQLVQKDSVVESVPVIKHKKLTPYRKESKREQLSRYYFQTKYMMDSQKYSMEEVNAAVEYAVQALLAQDE